MAWLSSLFEKRNLNNPSTPLSAPADWLWDAFGARKATTGVRVTPENALETTTVWAAVRMISSTVATLPLVTYRHTDAGKERAREHPVYDLLHSRPNPEMSSFIWREMTMAHLLLYGNAYAEIERNGRGDPVALWPLFPTNVRWERIGGEKVYIVRVEGQEVPLPAENILHIPGFSLDGHTGLFPIDLARNSIGLAKATEEFGASFFGNGAAPSGVLTHPGKLGPEGAANLRESWQKLYGGLSNAQRVAILEEGMQWNPLGVPPEHAQFLETRKFSVSEIARIFLIPPHLIGDLERATFSNIEHQSIQYVTHCIEPWTRRIEQEINYKLFDDRSHFAEFVLEGLLRGDSAARSAYYREMVNIGALTINEVRELENMNRIEGGDTPRVPLNTAPLSGDGKEAA
ncbi:MAG TPA: phage portal protein [Longimicrobiales bacterium]